MREFASNSYSYLQVILVQCKINRGSDVGDLQTVVNDLMAEEGIKANSIKMIYTSLRDNAMCPLL